MRVSRVCVCVMCVRVCHVCACVSCVWEESEVVCTPVCIYLYLRMPLYGRFLRSGLLKSRVFRPARATNNQMDYRVLSGLLCPRERVDGGQKHLSPCHFHHLSPPTKIIPFFNCGIFFYQSFVILVESDSFDSRVQLILLDWKCWSPKACRVNRGDNGLLGIKSEWSSSVLVLESSPMSGNNHILYQSDLIQPFGQFLFRTSFLELVTQIHILQTANCLARRRLWHQPRCEHARTNIINNHAFREHTFSTYFSPWMQYSLECRKEL